MFCKAKKVTNKINILVIFIREYTRWLNDITVLTERWCGFR